MEHFQVKRMPVVQALLLAAGMLTSCEKDTTEPVQIVDEDAITRARAVYSNRSINFNSYSNGTYTQANAISDFGNVGSWAASRTYISSKHLRVTLLPNDLGSSGGLITDVNIDNHSLYTLSFDVRFHSQFDWSRGGKVGFGLKIGDGNTGCDKADDGNGGSARLMWTTNNFTTPPKFKPYVYYKDMPDNCGDNFGVFYPSSGGLEKTVWYTVTIEVKSNSGSSTNGYLKYIINGTTIVDQAIRWTTNDAKRYVEELAVSTYRGGTTPDWESDTIGYIYFDNVSWSTPY